MRALRLSASRLFLSAAVSGALALTASCANDEPRPAPSDDGDAPSVSIAGTHALLAGTFTTLVAVTKDGDDASYTWTSERPEVASVDGGGTVRAHLPGEVLITATGDDTDAVGVHPIVVQAAPPPIVAIAGAHRVTVGATSELVAITVNGEDADYVWSSADEEIVTVVDGVVTGVDVGDTIISATGIDTGAVGSFTVAVIGAAAVVITGPFFMQVASDAQLTATTVNDVDTSYTWASSDESVATVSESGVVHAIAAGDVRITATGATSGLAGELGVIVQQTIPHFDEWASSGHADHAAVPFNNWNAQGAVPTSCARCHSDQGYRDYLGDDGSAVGSVDAPAPIGSVVECTTCHNDTASALREVTFPSGERVTDLGDEARCMVCHQGRASTQTVDDAITAAAVGADDVSPSLGFINIHYFAAAATLYAGNAKGAYQYAGKTYDVRFRHVPARDTCIECHDQHTLQIRVNECRTCHTAVASVDDLKNVRMMSSLRTDYDGDGNLSEGIAYEMYGVRDVVLDRIRAYAREKSGAAICYSADAYPYFFIDGDDDGVCSETEATNANKYAAWTPRLLRAAYNYQVASKDPGAFAHNAKYIIETLYDSAVDVNGALASPATLTIARNDPGHFNGSGKPARNWDTADEGVSASCSRCHGASEGFRFYLSYGVGEKVLEQGNGLDCATCHDTFENVQDPSLRFLTVPLNSVTYPSGVIVTREGDKGNICATCHQGRSSKQTVDDKIAAAASGGPALSFQNIHYYPAGAIRMGGTVRAGYQYDGNTYAGEWTGHLGGSSCVDCHNPQNTEHTFRVEDNLLRCNLCHVGVEEPTEIRTARHPDDTDGDGDTDEPLAEELDTLSEALLAEMRLDAANICYGNGNPYFFKDTNGSGAHCDANEISNGNRFTAWTPALLKAAYNYQVWHVDPGAWAHNYDYVAQLLIDSIDDLGGDVAAYARPAP